MLFVQVYPYSFPYWIKEVDWRLPCFLHILVAFAVWMQMPCYLRYIFIKIEDVLFLSKMFFFIFWFFCLNSSWKFCHNSSKNILITTAKYSGCYYKNTLGQIIYKRQIFVAHNSRCWGASIWEDPRQVDRLFCVLIWQKAKRATSVISVWALISFVRT